MRFRILAANVANAAAERLTRIAEDILLASNLDSGRLQLERQEVDVEALARGVVDDMRAFWAGRDDIRLELAAEGPLPPVAADADRLRQVLVNLIDNTVKYSPKGGRVELRALPRDKGLRVTVADEGLGIPHGEQQRLFGKFYRVDPNLTRGVRGTGLGLYICRELVRRMNGHITVESKEGRRSTFIVDLPLASSVRVGRKRAVPQTA